VAPIRVAAPCHALNTVLRLSLKILTVETPGPATNLHGENEKPAEAEANWSLREEVSIFLSSTGFLLLLHSIAALHGKLLEHLAIIKFALCHFRKPRIDGSPRHTVSDP